MSHKGTWSDFLTPEMKAKANEFFEEGLRKERWVAQEVMQPIPRVKDGHKYAVKGARP